MEVMEHADLQRAIKQFYTKVYVSYTSFDFRIKNAAAVRNSDVTSYTVNPVHVLHQNVLTSRCGSRSTIFNEMTSQHGG